MFRLPVLAVASCVAVGVLSAPASAAPAGATRVVSLSMPRSGEAHQANDRGGFSVSGVVQRWNGSAWRPLENAHVRLYWRMKGTAKWKKDEEAWSGYGGSFKVKTGVVPGTWSIRAQVDAASGHAASTSGSVTTTVTDKVRFESVSAYRDTRGTTLVGWVDDYIGGRQFASTHGRTVKFYYRRKGTKTWRYYRSGKLNRDEFFRVHVPRNRGYYFRVVFPKQGFFLGVTSRTL